MAAELQSWISETAEAAMDSRRGRDYLRGEDWVFTLKVASVTGSGPYFVEAEHGGQDEGLVILVDGQTKPGSKKERVKQGDLIGIRAPTWSIDVMGKSWAVGVDWAIM